MGFIARLKVDGPVSSRVYVHSQGVGDLGGRGLFGQEPIFETRNYLGNILLLNKRELKGFDFFLGFVWGDLEYGQRMASLFGFSLEGNGQNLMINNFVFRNYYRSLFDSLGFSDSLVVLGREEEFRREAGKLQDYKTMAPDLSSLGLNFKVDDFLCIRANQQEQLVGQSVLMEEIVGV